MNKKLAFLSVILVIIVFTGSLRAYGFIMGPYYAGMAYKEYESVKTSFDNRLEQMFFMWGRVTRDPQRNFVFTTANDRLISQYDEHTTYGFPGDKSLVDFKARCPDGKAVLSVFFASDLKGDGAIDLLNMSKEQWQNNIIDPVIKFAKDYDFQGINLDFEGLRNNYANSSYTQDKRGNLKYKYNAFVAQLKSSLSDLKLSVCIHPANVVNYYNGYDLTFLNKLCDNIILMAYDYQNEDKNGNMNIFETEPYNKVLEAVNQTLYSKKTGAGINPEKLILGISIAPVKWLRLKNIKNNAITYSYKKANGTPFLDDVENLNGQETYNKKTMTVKKTIPGKNAPLNDKKVYESVETKIDLVDYYYENTESIEEKYSNLIKKYNLAGISVWRLGVGSDSIWKGLMDLFYPEVIPSTPAPVESEDLLKSPEPEDQSEKSGTGISR